MSDIQPFKGCRPRADLASKIASPPYDVLSSKEAREMAKDNPLSFLRVVKAEIDLDENIDVHSETVYEKSRENFQNLLSNGSMLQDEKPCFYVYKQKMGNHTQVGLVAGASVDEYQNDLIKKHEHTRPEKENDRARHVEILGANAGPVFLTYKSDPTVDETIMSVTKTQEPVYDFTAPDGVVHTLWVVSSDEAVNQIQNAFKNVPALYVADGHHRSAAASRVREIKKSQNPAHTGKEQYNYFLSVIFPDNQLQILDYNRAVKDLNGLSEIDFKERIAGKFEIEETTDPKPKQKHEFAMYLGGKWYTLKAKEGSFDNTDPVHSLDASILQNNLLAPVLGIENPRTDSRIDFIGGIRGLKELEKRCAEDSIVAFALFPTSITDLISVADAGMVMPPKSTWFEPKLRSGMVVKLLD